MNLIHRLKPLITLQILLVSILIFCGTICNYLIIFYFSGENYEFLENFILLWMIILLGFSTMTFAFLNPFKNKIKTKIVVGIIIISIASIFFAGNFLGKLMTNNLINKVEKIYGVEISRSSNNFSPYTCYSISNGFLLLSDDCNQKGIKAVYKKDPKELKIRVYNQDKELVDLVKLSDLMKKMNTEDRIINDYTLHVVNPTYYKKGQSFSLKLELHNRILLKLWGEEDFSKTIEYTSKGFALKDHTFNVSTEKSKEISLKSIIFGSHDLNHVVKDLIKYD